MPLVAYMKTTDPNRVSTISANDEDRRMRKKIVPPGTKIDSHVCERVYVLDCLEHIGGVSVPADIRRFNEVANAWESGGIGRLCPLCWRMVLSPTGEKDPPVTPIVPVELATKTKTTKPRPVGERQKKLDALHERFNARTVGLWARAFGEFDIYQVMVSFDVPRTQAYNLLQLMIRAGIISETVRRGRGQRSTFRFSQKKEA